MLCSICVTIWGLRHRAAEIWITMTAYGEPAEDALKLSEERIKELDALWSVTDESSDICKMNQSNGASTEVSRETVEVLRFALDMANKTNGALDPTISPVITAWGFISGEHHIPSENDLANLLRYVDYKKVNENFVTMPDGVQLELGAVGKEYTGDIISELLKEQGVTSALLDLKYPGFHKYRLKDETILSFPGFEIRPERRKIYGESQKISLTTKEFDILYILAVNKGRVVTYEQIYRNVWNEYPTGRESDTVGYRVPKKRVLRSSHGLSPRKYLKPDHWYKVYRKE